jgi:hypothetical protein
MCEEDALYRAYLERAEAAKPRSNVVEAIATDGAARPAQARASGERPVKPDAGK